MTPAELHHSFPDNIPLPDLLVSLCAFTDEDGGDGGTISADLELYERGPSALDAWFHGDAPAASQFIVFASDATGALYGYWRYEGQPLDRAPLVYLNDEGAHNTVLASTLAQFLILVGVGQKYVGMVDVWDEHEAPDSYTLRYRDWLRTELGVEPPTLDEARAIIAQARGQHPDLDAWVEQSLVAAN